MESIPAASLPHLLPSPLLPLSAAAALQGVAQVPEVASRLVALDAGAAAAALPPSAPPPGQQGGQPQMGPSLSHDYLSALPGGGAGGHQPGQGQYGGGGGMRNVGSSPALLYGTTGGSSSQLDYLLSGGGGAPGMAAAASLQQLQQQAAAGGGYADHQTAQLLSAAGLGGGGGNPLAGMNRSFSEMSLDSNNAAGLGNRYATNSLSTGDLLAMTQGLQGGGGQGGGLRGIASTGSMWPNHQHHQHQHASLGSSPVGAGGWPGGLAGSSHGSLQDLLHKQAAVNAALQQQAAVSAALGLQQPNPLVQNAALQAAMQQALLTQQAAALLGHGGLGGAGMLGGVGRRGGDAPLGGRLARRPLDPVAEAERRMQQVGTDSGGLVLVGGAKRWGTGAGFGCPAGFSSQGSLFSSPSSLTNSAPFLTLCAAGEAVLFGLEQDPCRRGQTHDPDGQEHPQQVHAEDAAGGEPVCGDGVECRVRLAGAACPARAAAAAVPGSCTPSPHLLRLLACALMCALHFPYPALCAAGGGALPRHV